MAAAPGSARFGPPGRQEQRHCHTLSPGRACIADNAAAESRMNSSVARWQPQWLPRLTVSHWHVRYRHGGPCRAAAVSPSPDGPGPRRLGTGPVTIRSEGQWQWLRQGPWQGPNFKAHLTRTLWHAGPGPGPGTPAARDSWHRDCRGDRPGWRRLPVVRVPVWHWQSAWVACRVGPARGPRDSESDGRCPDHVSPTQPGPGTVTRKLPCLPVMTRTRMTTTRGQAVMTLDSARRTLWHRDGPGLRPAQSDPGQGSPADPGHLTGKSPRTRR